MDVLIAIAVCLPVGFGLGYWFKARGVAGLKSDLQDAKDQIARLKQKV